DAHGQRLARLGDDVAVGVAAQAFADVGLDLQLAAAVGAAVEVLGADTERYRIAEGQGRAAQRQLQAAPGVQLYLAALGMYADDRTLEETHLRRAEKTGDEEIGRVVIELHRRADLLDAPPVEHHHLVGQGHG